MKCSIPCKHHRMCQIQPSGSSHIHRMDFSLIYRLDSFLPLHLYCNGESHSDSEWTTLLLSSSTVSPTGFFCRTIDDPWTLNYLLLLVPLVFCCLYHWSFGPTRPLLLTSRIKRNINENQKTNPPWIPLHGYNSCHSSFLLIVFLPSS